MATRVLLVTSLDDLKDRISRLVLLILIVEFFGLALQFSATTALDLLALGLGIFLVAAAMYLGSQHSRA